MFYRITNNQRIAWYKRDQERLRKTPWLAHRKCLCTVWKNSNGTVNWLRVILQEKAPIDFWSRNYPKYFSHSDLKNWLSISVIQTLAHVRNLAVFIKEKPPILFFRNQLFKFCQTRINQFHENWNRFIFVQCSVFQTSMHQTLASSLWLVFNHS